MTPWLISFVIALILISAAYRAKAKANNSQTIEGSTVGLYLMYFFSVVALGFIMLAVSLAK